MMYGWDSGMMGSWVVLWWITWLVILVNLVLLGIWLFQQITKKK